MDETLKHIEAINFEAIQFLSAFCKFRDSFNAIDPTLCSNLLGIVNEIDNFLERKPKVITTPQEDQISPVDIRRLGYRRVFICQKCKSEVGSSLNEIRFHMKTSRHLSVKNNRTNDRAIARRGKLDDKIVPRRVKSLLLSDIQSFITENVKIANKLTNLADYRDIERDLLKLVNPSFPDHSMRVYFFGSRLSGIGNIYSDLDIYLEIGDVFNVFENRASPETIKKLKTVQDLLQGDPNWGQLVSIESARVPILKVVHYPTSTNCDIGFSNSLGFCNTKLIHYLLELQPIAKIMCLFMKKWLERSKLSEHINTYSAILLVVYYLQMKKILPSIKTLQDDIEKTVEIGPWMAVFAEKSLTDLGIAAASYSLRNIKKELKQFFQFYSAFDFGSNLICPYLGQVIPFVNLENSPLLPRYVKYVNSENDKKECKIEQNHINVQDPFQMNNNVTKAVPKSVLLLLKQYFEMSADILPEGEIPKKDEK